MRNLKRALSLALAFVMVMSLMIVGTSAKSYTDADKIDNQVAVEILGEIGVMVGNDDGSFAPDRDVTRAEMAVIITRILYGNNLNVDQFKNMNTFTDVPDWAEGFVNLCASLDIIAGRGNGIFDPDATVTSAEAALMLSRALGYFKNNAEFGNDWALAAMKRATQIGIIGGDMVLQANAGLDRDDVAQMTFNTLTKAVPVQYNELLNVYYNVNQGIIYALEFNYLQTLGYTNFGLVYKTNEQTVYGRPATTWGIGSYKDTGSGTASGIEKAELTDEGGLIASNVRMLDKDQIITVANTPDYVYDNGTDEKDVYDDLGATLCNDAKGQTASEEYDWTAYINGVEQDTVRIPEKNVSDDYRYTDKGSVTEIYVDDYDQTVTVVEINYYLGQVSKVNDDDTITVKELSTEPKLDDDTFATTEFAEDDYVVFTVDYNDDNDYYICELMAPETATGDVTHVQNENNSDNTYIRLDNEDAKYYYTSEDHICYDVSEDGQDKHPDLNEEYILYMTPAGYVLGFEPTAEKIDQYLYVLDTDEDLRDWNARVVLPDATQPKVELDEDLGNTGANTPYPFEYSTDNGANYADAVMGKTINWINNNGQTVDVKNLVAADVADGELDLANTDFLIWNYSVNSSDVYSLERVPFRNDSNHDLEGTYQSRVYDAEITNGRAFVGSNVDNNAKFFIVDKKTIFVDTMNDVAYTGYDEVPNVDNATLAYVVEDKVAQIVFILEGDIYDVNSTYFVLADTDRETAKNSDAGEYWIYENAYVDGQKTSLKVTYDAVEKLVDTLTPAEEALYLADGSAAAGDAAHKILTEGVLYKATKTIVDGEYIDELEVVALDAGYIHGTPNTVGDDAFWIKTDNNKSEQFDTDDETIYVTVRRLVKSNGVLDKYVIDDGDIDDLKALDNTNKTRYSAKTAWVVKDVEDNTARLVYIFWAEWDVSDVVDVDFAGDTTDYTVAAAPFAVKGEAYNFTITPEAGKQIAKVTVNGVELKANADGVSYTVAKVSKDLEIVVDMVDVANVNVTGDGAASAVVYVNGKKITGESGAIEVGADVSIRVAQAAGEKAITALSINGESVAVGEVYTTTMPADGILVVVEAAEPVEQTMDVFVTYVDENGAAVDTQLVEGITAEADKNYALLSSAANKDLLQIPADYEFVSANTPVSFEANGYATANVVVKQKTYTISFETAGKIAGTEITSLTGVKNGDTITVTSNGGTTGWNNGLAAKIQVTSSDCTVECVSAVKTADADSFTLQIKVTGMTDNSTITLTYNG